jgi:hypothetical protein
MFPIGTGTLKDLADVQSAPMSSSSTSFSVPWPGFPRSAGSEGVQSSLRTREEQATQRFCARSVHTPQIALQIRTGRATRHRPASSQRADLTGRDARLDRHGRVGRNGYPPARAVRNASRQNSTPPACAAPRPGSTQSGHAIHTQSPSLARPAASTRCIDANDAKTNNPAQSAGLSLCISSSSWSLHHRSLGDYPWSRDENVLTYSRLGSLRATCLSTFP